MVAITYHFFCSFTRKLLPLVAGMVSCNRAAIITAWRTISAHSLVVRSNSALQETCFSQVQNMRRSCKVGISCYQAEFSPHSQAHPQLTRLA